MLKTTGLTSAAKKILKSGKSMQSNTKNIKYNVKKCGAKNFQNQCGELSKPMQKKLRDTAKKIQRQCRIFKYHTVD